MGANGFDKRRMGFCLGPQRFHPRHRPVNGPALILVQVADGESG